MLLHPCSCTYIEHTEFLSLRSGVYCFAGPTARTSWMCHAWITDCHTRLMIVWVSSINRCDDAAYYISVQSYCFWNDYLLLWNSYLFWYICSGSILHSTITLYTWLYLTLLSVLDSHHAWFYFTPLWLYYLTLYYKTLLDSNLTLLDSILASTVHVILQWLYFGLDSTLLCMHG